MLLPILDCVFSFLFPLSNKIISPVSIFENSCRYIQEMKILCQGTFFEISKQTRTILYAIG